MHCRVWSNALNRCRCCTGDGTVTKDEWEAAHSGGETTNFKSVKTKPGAWAGVPAWSPQTRSERSPHTNMAPQLENLMQLEIQRQRHIKHACSFLARLQVCKPKPVGMACAPFHMLSTHNRLFREPKLQSPSVWLRPRNRKAT